MEDENALPDERLKLLFMCCHPALALEARVVLALRMFGGLTSDQIALAFRVPPAKITERLTSAKAKIKKAEIPFGVPQDGSLPERLDAVLATIYQMFSESYAGDGELAAEAIRLGRILAELMPDESEVHGLLALMLLNDGRRSARFRHGELVLLDDQERTLWDRERIAEGERSTGRSPSRRSPARRRHWRSSSRSSSTTPRSTTAATSAPRAPTCSIGSDGPSTPASRTVERSS